MIDYPLRIAFIDNILEPDKPGRSGMSDTIWDMAGALVAQGHEPHIIGSYQTTAFPDQRVQVHHFPTPPIGYRNIVGQTWMLKRAAAVSRHIQPDIIHARDYYATAVFTKLGVRTPLVLTVPGNIFKRIREGHGYEWYFTQVLKWAARVSVRHCARVIATSREMKQWWEWTGSIPERTPWIPLGVNVQRFQRVEHARERLSLSHNGPLLLYVGRFSREKGLLDFVAALGIIQELLIAQNARVILIGRGPQEDEIRKVIAAEGLESIVQLLPWAHQDELSTWYSAADVLVMPSWNEPFGKVMIEAMACGTPVVSAITEGAQDHIQEGSNGFLFPPHDVAQLANLVRRCVTHRQELSRMGQQAHAYVQEHLSWTHIAQRIVDEVYAPILFQTSTQRFAVKSMYKQ